MWCQKSKTCGEIEEVGFNVVFITDNVENCPVSFLCIPQYLLKKCVALGCVFRTMWRECISLHIMPCQYISRLTQAVSSSRKELPGVGLHIAWDTFWVYFTTQLHICLTWLKWFLALKTSQGRGGQSKPITCYYCPFNPALARFLQIL